MEDNTSRNRNPKQVIDQNQSRNEQINCQSEDKPLVERCLTSVKGPTGGDRPVLTISDRPVIASSQLTGATASSDRSVQTSDPKVPNCADRPVLNTSDKPLFATCAERTQSIDKSLSSGERPLLTTSDQKVLNSSENPVLTTSDKTSVTCAPTKKSVEPNETKSETPVHRLPAPTPSPTASVRSPQASGRPLERRRSPKPDPLRDTQLSLAKYSSIGANSQLTLPTITLTDLLLEVKTKSIESTLIPLVNQVRAQCNSNALRLLC